MSKPIISTQSLAKACNEALILAALRNGPRHGYQLALDITERSGGRFGFQHGTLYPILHKLEKDGLIVGAWSNEGPGARRKQYSLTDKGRNYAREQRNSWRDFFTSFLAVIGEAEA